MKESIMLRTLLFSILTFSSLMSNEVSERLIPLGHDFFMKTESFELYDRKGKVMRLYQKLDSRERKYLLTFVLDETIGGCHQEGVEKGSYEVNGSEITLYTLWERKESDNAPYGARIQRYMVDDNGEFELFSSKVYIETDARSEAKQSAMQYLFQTPVTQSQKEALQEYIQSVEKRFKGAFVLGRDAQSLIEEVKEALHRQIQKRWH